MNQRGFNALRVNARQPKPRTRGITEIRGPYYTPMGKRYLSDVLETFGAYVDSLKFAGGAFTLMPSAALKELIDLAHAHGVSCSTGGFLEAVLPQGPAAGAYMVMIESEGITECVKTWRTDVAATVIEELGLERVMFEAADPPVFSWYIRNYGPEVNLFVDHSQIVQLECLRSGIWGTNELWGRVVTYKGGKPLPANERKAASPVK